MRKRRKDNHLPPCVYHKHGAYWYVKKGKWERLGTTLQESLAAYANRVDQSAGDVATLIDRVLDDAKGRVKPNTLLQYKLLANELRSTFVEFNAHQVKPAHVDQFMQHIHHKPNWANRCRSFLKMVFDLAVRLDYCQSNPVIYVPKFKERKRDRYITDSEYQAIHSLANPVTQAIMDIAYLTGQRIGDVLKIKRSDISQTAITFKQQKTGKKLAVAITSQLQVALDNARRLHGRITPTYILAKRDGHPRGYHSVREQFLKAANAAGVEDVGLHDIRAKSITDAKRQGLDPRALAGHTTESQTATYIRDKETPTVNGPSFRQSNKNIRQ